MNRPSLLLLALAALLSSGCGDPPITIICPWAPGGGTDRVSRYWADALQQKLDRPVVVVNRTGGSGASGHAAGANAAPDGNTLTTITFELCTMHQMGISQLTHEDFRPLLQINADPAAIIVRTDSPYESLRDFLDAIKASPGEVTMSGTAAKGAWDLARAGLLLADSQPVNAVTWMPTDGAAPSLVELIGGHIDAVCCSVPEAAQAVQSGELKVLAVMAEQRLEAYPDVPTAKEQGVDWVAMGWRGLALPKGVEQAKADAIEAACLEIAQSAEYREFMEDNGFGVTIRGAEEFRRFLAEQDRQWQGVIEAAGYAAP